jgi:hypothetical protein
MPGKYAQTCFLRENVKDRFAFVFDNEFTLAYSWKLTAQNRANI